MRTMIVEFMRAALDLSGIGVEGVGSPEVFSHLPSVCRRCACESPRLYSDCADTRREIAEGARHICPRGHTLVGYEGELVAVFPKTVAGNHRAQLGASGRNGALSRFLDRICAMLRLLDGDDVDAQDWENGAAEGPHLRLIEVRSPTDVAERLVPLTLMAPDGIEEATSVSPTRHPHLVATVHSLIAAVDAKDQYTRGHSERVHIVACQLGEILGLDEDTSNHLYWASLLHDVGKIGSPDHILKKPGRLEPDEYRIMKEHPVRGDELLAPLAWLREARRGVRHHHERIDGGGYPDGLKGNNIPIIARIIAVADTFDAVVSRRHYRDERDARQALEVLIDAAGSQLDMDVVAAFEGSFERIYHALEEAPIPAEGLQAEPELVPRAA